MAAKRRHVCSARSISSCGELADRRFGNEKRDSGRMSSKGSRRAHKMRCRPIRRNPANLSRVKLLQARSCYYPTGARRRSSSKKLNPKVTSCSGVGAGAKRRHQRSFTG
jgi:hypothetical protein